MLFQQRLFELLHMDLFRSSRTMSIGGNYYALVVVDDFSRFTWTLFIKSRSDAFKKLSKLLQNKNCSNICSIWSHHGGWWLFYSMYRVKSDKLSLMTDIELTRNSSKISSVTFTKYKQMCKSLFVPWICKKLNKSEVNDLDESIGKIGIGVQLLTRLYSQWIKTYNIPFWVILMHI